MSGKNTHEGIHLVSPISQPRNSWPTYPDHELLPLSNLGLFLYLTFEDDAEDDWWPLEV